MSEAVRKGRTRTTKRKNLAKDNADVFTIYINPLAKEKDDPELLQQRAHPILKAWKEDGVLKEQILKAVLWYLNAELSQEMMQDLTNRDLLDKMTERFKRMLSEARIAAKNDNQQATVDLLDELSDDMMEFASEFMNYGE